MVNHNIYYRYTSHNGEVWSIDGRDYTFINSHEAKEFIEGLG